MCEHQNDFSSKKVILAKYYLGQYDVGNIKANIWKLQVDRYCNSRHFNSATDEFKGQSFSMFLWQWPTMMHRF